jgi:glycosyltransferase involved in cell wall biosynthesis
MRVGFDARWYNDSGVGVYVVELLRAMAAVGQPAFELIVYEDPRNRVPQLDGQPVSRMPVAAPRYSLAEQFELRRRARLDKLDLFHSPFYVMPLGLSCPVIVTLHDAIPFLFSIYSWPKSWMVKTGYRTAASRAQHIIAVSGNTANDIREILKVPEERITVVYNGTRECFQPVPGQSELVSLLEKFDVQSPYVVTASASNWRTKNLESALKALQAARCMSGVEFQTVVYGPANGIDAVGGDHRWSSLRLRRTGFLPAEGLAMLFRHAHAFLMPSLYEGFGLPVVEAMSCGCPVVTSNGGSLAEIAGQGAQVFDPFDVEGMAGAVARLLSEPAVLSQWRSRARQRALCFSWKRAADQTIAVYRSALAARAAKGAAQAC